jgi:IS30 family transposase
MRYTQISLNERFFIEKALKIGMSLNKIGAALERSVSTISREIAGNIGKRGYRHKQANRKAEERHKKKRKAFKLTEEVKMLIAVYLKAGWSPEQIAGRLKKEGIISLHHESIYRYINLDRKSGGTLYTHLRHQGKKYRKGYGTASNRTGIPNRVDIDERPEEANNRECVGHWEADTIIGKNHRGAIVTLDERKSKLRLAFPLQSRNAQDTTKAMQFLLIPFKSFVKTITFDNGKEFTLHEKIAKSLGCQTYFAKPYHSWERGQNENANGLLRQYFPKSMELKDISIKQVFEAVHKLNNRPRKCLGFKTPYEVFQELTGFNVKNFMGVALIT